MSKAFLRPVLAPVFGPLLGTAFTMALLVTSSSAFAQAKGGAAATATAGAGKEEGYGYTFTDDPLSAGGFGPNDATIRVRPNAVRNTLIRPRTSFVVEMLKSVENLKPRPRWNP